jgi:hypothetical protein
MCFAVLLQGFQKVFAMFFYQAFRRLLEIFWRALRRLLESSQTVFQRFHENFKRLPQGFCKACVELLQGFYKAFWKDFKMVLEVFVLRGDYKVFRRS